MTLPSAEIRRWCADTRALLDRIERTLEPANDVGTESLDQWIHRWLAERRTVQPEDDLRQYRLWIAPHLGALPVSSIRRDHLEAFVEMLDRQVIDGRMRGGTALRIWGLVTVMMRDAASAKVRSLRVRDDNPARSVRGPDRQAARASTFLYPSEFLRLIECPDVPLVYRRIYAATVYLYPRAGEVRALRWSDIDLTTGRVHIHASINRRGKAGRTKTEADRQFVAEATLLPMLRAMRREAPRATLVFEHFPQRHNTARALREHLETAELERADLYAADEGRRPLTYHDLRATGITWQAMRGDSPTDIMERVGHADLRTTQRYIRRGRQLIARGERVFPRLPVCLLKKST